MSLLLIKGDREEALAAGFSRLSPSCCLSYRMTGIIWSTKTDYNSTWLYMVIGSKYFLKELLDNRITLQILVATIGGFTLPILVLHKLYTISCSSCCTKL